MVSKLKEMRLDFIRFLERTDKKKWVDILLEDEVLG